ncbi:MAG: hypothetical protein KDK70_32110, partial [Myxococcales bacterium]|nr:hypothetical protein [Myxococcales bacterium]
MRRAPRAGAWLLVMAACSPQDDAPEADDGSEGSSGDAALVCSPEAGLELYERRIAPLLEDDRPSTCNQCHLAGVDLSLFLQDTPCATMACMVAEGLVDLDRPDDSLVLSWIERAEPSGGITEQT